MLLPSGRREREIVARAREDLLEKAEELGHCAAGSIRAMARNSTDATDRGLSPRLFSNWIIGRGRIMARSNAVRCARLFGAGLLVFAGAAAAQAQMSSDPAQITACLCQEQGLATLSADMSTKTQALAAVRQHLADLDAQLERARSTLDVNNADQEARYKALLDQRDAAYRQSIGPVVAAADQATARYNSHGRAIQCAMRQPPIRLDADGADPVAPVLPAAAVSSSPPGSARQIHERRSG